MFCFVFSSFRYGPSSCGHAPPSFPKPWRHVLSRTPSGAICAAPPTSSAAPPTAVPGSLQLPTECCKAKKPSCSYCTAQGEWLRCEGVCLDRYSQTSLIHFSKEWATQSTKQAFQNTVCPTKRVESRVFCNAGLQSLSPLPTPRSYSIPFPLEMFKAKRTTVIVGVLSTLNVSYKLKRLNIKDSHSA